MSYVLSKLNSSRSINNLKSVKIFMMNSFNIDVDYKIDINKYETNAPDLLIISPFVLITKNITIDLSCYRIPDFPDNKKKANDGRSKGDKGDDGKPGLPGYNGGDLIIIAYIIKNNSLINFKSNGGVGGPGQSGLK